MTTGTERTSKPVVVACVFCGKANRVDLARLDAGPKCGKCGRPIRLDRPLKVTDSDFDRIVSGASVPVVVDFYADWCGPCHMMAPILDEVARRKAGEALFLKLDTDANQVTPGRLGIRGLPTLIAFRNGRESGRHVGVADAAAVEKLLA
ncbi:MAG TPA: thioredoxin [Gemmatimonadales bacterium]|nr:thioredoxin [Gemmatimonadales bacterium]